MNAPLATLLSSGVSHTRAARHLGVHLNTVLRKLLFLEAQGVLVHRKLLEFHQQEFALGDIQFDELETFEHTKLKPLSVPLVIHAPTRLILGFDVCSMPAKGLLAEKSRKKYGLRPDHRIPTLMRLMESLQLHIQADARFKSDSHPFYPAVVKKVFPKARHETVISRESSVGGQGELKKIGFDPLFSLNHTCAMLRYSISRLIRKTWNTTKNPRNLKAHLWIYVVRHNERIIEQLLKAGASSQGAPLARVA